MNLSFLNPPYNLSCILLSKISQIDDKDLFSWSYIELGSVGSWFRFLDAGVFFRISKFVVIYVMGYFYDWFYLVYLNLFLLLIVLRIIFRCRLTKYLYFYLFWLMISKNYLYTFLNRQYKLLYNVSILMRPS